MWIRKLVAVVVAVGMPVSGAWAAESADHHRHQVASGAMSLNDGVKWATDEPLRKGMESIRTLVAASLDAVHDDKLTPAGYGELARKIDKEVGAIVAGCKLDPKADAQLHIVVAKIMSGADTMKGKTKKSKRMDGVVSIIGALDNYARYFDHPGWMPIRH